MAIGINISVTCPGHQIATAFCAQSVPNPPSRTRENGDGLTRTRKFVTWTFADQTTLRPTGSDIAHRVITRRSQVKTLPPPLKKAQVLDLGLRRRPNASRPSSVGSPAQSADVRVGRGDGGRAQ